MLRTTEETARMWENAGCKEIADAFYALAEKESGAVQELLADERVSDVEALVELLSPVRSENEYLREALQAIAAIRSDLKATIDTFLLAPEAYDFGDLLDKNNVLRY